MQILDLYCKDVTNSFDKFFLANTIVVLPEKPKER